jgi:hypothetical protein
MPSVMTTRQLGITGSASLSLRRYFAAVELPRQNPFFAKGCTALREIHAFFLAFGSVSKRREDFQTLVGFSVSLQPHGVAEIRSAYSTSRTSEKRSQPRLRLIGASPTERFFFTLRKESGGFPASRAPLDPFGTETERVPSRQELSGLLVGALSHTAREFWGAEVHLHLHHRVPL